MHMELALEFRDAAKALPDRAMRQLSADKVAKGNSRHRPTMNADRDTLY
jgi:hypothetical protein